MKSLSSTLRQDYSDRYIIELFDFFRKNEASGDVTLFGIPCVRIEKESIACRTIINRLNECLKSRCMSMTLEERVAGIAICNQINDLVIEASHKLDESDRFTRFCYKIQQFFYNLRPLIKGLYLKHGTAEDDMLPHENFSWPEAILTSHHRGGVAKKYKKLPENLFGLTKFDLT